MFVMVFRLVYCKWMRVNDVILVTVICEISVQCVDHVGRGGSLVDSTPFVQRVAGSNPALAAA